MTLKETNYYESNYDSYLATPFLEPGNNIYKENEYYLAIYDKYPVCRGHLLFIPKKNNSFYIQEAFRGAYAHGEGGVKNKTIDGYHIGMNMHPAGGQTVMWPHIHYLPRHYGDSGKPGVGGSVRLARIGGKSALSYENHPGHEQWKVNKRHSS